MIRRKDELIVKNTFNTNKIKGHKDILNPIDNVIAAINKQPNDSNLRDIPNDPKREKPMPPCKQSKSKLTVSVSLKDTDVFKSLIDITHILYENATEDTRAKVSKQMAALKIDLDAHRVE